jgi:glycosyltransferase involved in cell wall biosynthesis
MSTQLNRLGSRVSGFLKSSRAGWKNVTSGLNHGTHLTLPMSTVTWILPVLNAEKFLDLTLQSIAAQSYTDHEILAWDNGSKDRSVEILKSWIPSKIPGRVVTHEPLGLGACLARMVLESKSDLCARIDGDDICFKGRLELQVQFMERNPDVVACGTQMLKIDESGRDLGQYCRRPEADVDLAAISLIQSPLNHPTVMFRRKSVLEVGNYRDIKPLEDWDLWIRLAEKGRLGNLKEDLLYYRIHSQSVTSSAKDLNDDITEMVAKNGTNVFGLSFDQLRAFRNRAYERSKLPLILRLALNLRRSRSLPRVLGSPWFDQACRGSIAPGDFSSRAFLLLGRFIYKTRSMLR